MKQQQSKLFYKILAAVLLALAFLLFVVALGALLLGCGKTADNFKAFNQADAFNIRQVITADSTTSRTVMWQSEEEEKDAFVEYRIVKTDGAKPESTVTQAKSSTQKERHRCRIKITGN